MKTSTRTLRAFFVATLALLTVTSTRAQFGPVDRLSVFVYSTAGTQITLSGGFLYADGRLEFVVVPTPIAAVGSIAAQVVGLSGAQLAAIDGKPLYDANAWSDSGDTFSKFRRSAERYIIADQPYYILSVAPASVATIIPATRSIVAGGATAQTFAVASSTSWTATTGVSWLTITGGASGSGNAIVTYNVAANTTIQQRVGVIAVAGQTHTVTQAAATSTVIGPANDLFASRISLAGASVTTTGSNVGATKETGEPTHASNTGGKSAWWTWTAPSSGSVSIDTFGSRFDTLLAVYTGSSISALTSVAANDDAAVDGTSRVTFSTTAGVAYQIAVDGYGGASGSITLRLLLATTSGPITITTQPASQTVKIGSTVMMTVTATGTAPLSYQWRKDGVNVNGATSASLPLQNIQAPQAGNYTVVITNANGSVTSSVAVLTVNAVSTEGPVVAWGFNGANQTIVPVGLSGITAIAAGGAHTVALKSNGAVVTWGSNAQGQTTIPVGLSGVTGIAAGGAHTVALKNNGTVVAWGSNFFGGSSSGPNFSGQATVPAGLSGVTAIAAGDRHTVALKSDGTVVVWGGNTFGQATVPTGLSGVMAIAAGQGHTVALNRGFEERRHGCGLGRQQLRSKECFQWFERGDGGRCG